MAWPTVEACTRIFSSPSTSASILGSTTVTHGADGISNDRGADGEDRREVGGDGPPGGSRVGGVEDLPRAGGHVDAAGAQRVLRHAFATDAEVRAFGGQAVRQLLPRGRAVGSLQAIDAELPGGRAIHSAFGLERRNVARVRVGRIEREPESELVGKSLVDAIPRVGVGVGAIHPDVVLLVQAAGRVKEELVDAGPDLALLQDLAGLVAGDPLVGRLPRLAAVVGSEDARRRDADVHAVHVLRVELDGVEAKPAGARGPV